MKIKLQTIALTLFTSALICMISSLDAQKMYWANTFTTRLWKSNLDGSGTENITPSSGIGDIEHLAIDPVDNKIYITDSGSDFFEVPPRIVRTNLDGTGIEVLLTGYDEPAAMDLDLINGKIYFNERETYKTYRANLDGSDAEEIPNPAGGIFYVYYMAVEGQNGHIYWALNEQVWRADLDGTNPQMFVSRQGSTGIRGITVDPESGDFYWLEDAGLFGGDNAVLYKSDANGDNITELRQLVDNNILDLTYEPVENKLYFSDSDDEKIFRLDADGSNLEEIYAGSGPYEGLSIHPTEGISSNREAIDELSGQLHLFPNPAIDQIQFNNPAPDQLHQVTISNLNGQIMQQQQVQSGVSLITIGLEEFASGSYWLRCYDNQGTLLARKQLLVVKP